MRPKFRAWDKIGIQMINDIWIDIENNWMVLADNDALCCYGKMKKNDVVLEQYTGRKDKKQNDAYLSDIAIDEFDQRWVVVWDDENAGYVLLLEGVAWADADESSVMLMQAIKDMEIIGTIHDEESKEIEP